MPQLTAIPAFHDNYIWAIYDHKYCVVVDPGQAHPVLDFLHTSNTQLSGILLTHHHADHIGGVNQLLQRHANNYPAAPPPPVIGPADQRIPMLTQIVGEADEVSLGHWNMRFKVLEIPGHTLSHIAFWNESWLFCGDTLFSAGCGRLFEGTPTQMQQSLDKLAALPGEILVCCGHEYTQSNCRFALQVEPDNPYLQQRYLEVNELRQRGEITLPVSLADELSYNPFLRSRQASVIQAARRRNKQAGQTATSPSVLLEEPHQVLAVIRSWKDTA